MTQGLQAEAGGPTVLRISLGSRLRALREASGISREDAGYHIRGSESKISRMELGRVGFKERDITDLLTLYGVTDTGEHDRLLTLARQANTPGWWHRYHEVLPSWFTPYLGLETAASMIRTFELQLIPALLQTADYARAIIGLDGRTRSPKQFEQRVSLCLQRQQVLTRANPLRLWVILDEAVLRRQVGSPKVMREQIQALANAAAQPHITVQILPLAAGVHPAGGSGFSILRFAHPQVPDIVYLEHLTSALYLDKPDDLDQYALAMGNLSHQAHPPDRTIGFLRTLLDQ